MTSDNFVYWLQGYLELSKEKTLDADQIKVIEDHIKMVLTKVTPAQSLSSPLLTIPCHLDPRDLKVTC